MHQGEVKRSRSRLTGTTVILLDARNGGEWVLADGARWITMCDDHSTIAEHGTRAVAESHMPYVEWCEQCQDNIGA